jgi:putative serine protease PepD
MTSTTPLGSFASAVLGALSVVVVVVVLAFAGVFDRDDEPARPAAAPASEASGERTARSAPDVAGVYERARRAVVDVQARTSQGRATGSGFVIGERGDIVTNQHVVDEARTVRIRFAGQDAPVTGRVRGTDPATDLAVVRVDPDRVRGGLRPLELATAATCASASPPSRSAARSASTAR